MLGFLAIASAAGAGSGESFYETNSELIAVRARPEVSTSNGIAGKPPGEDATWRTWWTSRVTAVEIYDSDFVWVRVKAPAGISAGDAITIPANGTVDLMFADEDPIDIRTVTQYRNFWTFPAGAITGTEWIYARVRNPSRASSRLVLIGPAELHEPYLEEYLPRNYYGAVVDGAEWVVHQSVELPINGWNDRQPDPRSVGGNVAVSLSFEASNFSDLQQSIWIRDVQGINRVIVWLDDRVYYDSANSATVPEARSPSGDLAVLLPGNSDSHRIVVTRLFRDTESLSGAFEQLIFPLRSIAYAPASILFRVFAEDSRSVKSARGFEYTRNLLLILASAIGLFAALARKGAGFKSFLMFSLISILIFLALNSINIWRPLYRVLLLIPGPPKTVPIFAVFLTPYVLIKFVGVSVKEQNDSLIRILTRITLGLGIVYAAIYIFFLLQGQYHIAEQVAGFVVPVYATSIAAIVVLARGSKDRGIMLSFAAFGVIGILTAVWASLFAGSDDISEAVTLVLVCSMVFSLIGVPMTVYSAAERSLSSTNKIFRRFVPEEFLAYLGINEIEKIEVGRQVEADLTLMFCDIRSFTSLSENLAPGEVMDLINRYLDKIGPIIRENHGFVDKYLGDGIMAVFPGSPIDACRAALRIIDGASDIDIDHKLEFGVGLHYGPAMLGTIGERGRMDTTVLSDAVNVASRLQSMSSEFNATILVSGAVKSRAAIKHGAEFEYVDDIKVKGRNEPVETYKLISTRESGAV